MDSALGLTDGGSAAIHPLPGADGLLAAANPVPAPQIPASVRLSDLTNKQKRVPAQLRSLLRDAESGLLSQLLSSGGEKRKAAPEGSAQTPGGKVSDVAKGAAGQGTPKAGDSKGSPLLGSTGDVTSLLDLGNMAE